MRIRVQTDDIVMTVYEVRYFITQTMVFDGAYMSVEDLLELTNGSLLDLPFENTGWSLSATGMPSVKNISKDVIEISPEPVKGYWRFW